MEDRFCFAPFDKGGYGGFAFGEITEQEQIPLGPLNKGEDKRCYQFAPMILGSGSMATPKRVCTESAMRRARESN